MPIVSSEVFSLSPSGDRVNVVYRFTDHVAEIHDVTRLVPNTTDHNAALIALTPVVNARIIRQEENNIEGRVESGEDPLIITSNPVHSTRKRLVKKLLFWMMREKNPFIVILLEPLIIDIRANFTSIQLQNFLDLTATQVTRLNNRINFILDNKTAFLAFRDSDEEFGGI
jgi:hypothetical protein